MHVIRWLTLPILAGLLIGCAANDGGNSASSPSAENDIKASLAKLSDNDREAAEEQKFCAVKTNNRLGSMGVPVKITIKNKEGKDQDVFLCCKPCEKEARK